MQDRVARKALRPVAWVGRGSGLKVAILEKNDSLGGATVSQKVFPEYEARLSRYSYLVSLLPDQIIEDLGLKFKTIKTDFKLFPI